MSFRDRTQARTLALQALCLYDALGDSFDEQLDSFLHDTVNYADLGLRPSLASTVLPLARELARETWRFRARTDACLKEQVPDWAVSRMPPVDRNILRLGLYELLEQPQTPPPVVINEAVELARRFGGTDSPAFVNGVLDGLRRRLSPQTSGAGRPAPDAAEPGSGDGAV